MQLPCPNCGEPVANVSVPFATLPEAVFHCNECDTDFDAAGIRRFIAVWSAVLDWLGKAPSAD